MGVVLLIICGAIVFAPIGCALSLFLGIIDEIEKINERFRKVESLLGI